MVAGDESFEWIWEGDDGTAATGDLSEGRRNEGATSGEAELGFEKMHTNIFSVIYSIS
jgi:hypothetical protein